MKGIRVKPISGDMASIQISCECGRVTKYRAGATIDEFTFSVLCGNRSRDREPQDASFNLHCACGKTYRVLVQSDHFHVNEIEKGMRR